MKTTRLDRRKSTENGVRVAAAESLRLKPVYGLGAGGVGDAQEIGGGTLSPMLKESRLYTSGRSLRS